MIDAKSKWVSATIGKDAYRTEIKSEHHTLLADEPVDIGGKDLGPDPGDFLRISLASCTAITLRMYASRKGYDIRQIEVKVRSEQKDGKTIFDCDIQLDGVIDDAQKKRMLQIAKACPVHKVFLNPIEVNTMITDQVN